MYKPVSYPYQRYKNAHALGKSKHLISSVTHHFYLQIPIKILFCNAISISIHTKVNKLLTFFCFVLLISYYQIIHLPALSKVSNNQVVAQFFLVQISTSVIYPNVSILIHRTYHSLHSNSSKAPLVSAFYSFFTLSLTYTPSNLVSNERATTAIGMSTLHNQNPSYIELYSLYIAKGDPALNPPTCEKTNYLTNIRIV